MCVPKTYEIDGFGGKHWAGNTRAVSVEKAINNVRFRLWGETSVADLLKIGITFEAEPVAEIAPTQQCQPPPRPEKSRPLCGRQRTWIEVLRRNPAQSSFLTRASTSRTPFFLLY